MFGPGNYTLPLTEVKDNDVQLQTDVEMKVISEYTEVISEEEEEEEEEDKIIEYEIVTVKELEDQPFKNLENCVSNDAYNDSQDSNSRCKMSIVELSPTSYNDQILSDTYISDSFNDDQDSISRCKMSIEELSPSSDTNHVFEVESEYTCLAHLVECVINDTYEENKQPIKEAVSLDDAFRQCLRTINSDLNDPNDDYNLDNTLKQFNKNDSPTETNHKRKILHSDELIATDNDDINCSCGTPKEQSYFENTKKKRIVGDMIRIASQTPKSCQKIYHNIYFTESEIEYFRKSYQKFLQKSICLTLPPQIGKCIECRVYNTKDNLTKRDYDSITCRFYEFRQLRYQKCGTLAVAGYPDPYKNIDNVDLSLWLPNTLLSERSDFNIQASTKILGDAGGQFCMFVKDEIDALKFNLPRNGKPRKILWKKSVNGVREMCDVCRTTIFNHHWCCRKCGFVVCIDCFKAKLNGTQLTEKQTIVQRNFNKKIWLLCSNEKEHQIEKLFITQILAGNTLKFISDLLHDICFNHNISLDCSCNETLEKIFPPNSTDPIFDNILKIYEQLPGTKDKEEPSLEGIKGIMKRQYLRYLDKCCNDDGSTKETEEVEFESNGSTSISRKKVQDKMYTIGRITKRKELFPPKLSLLSDDKTHAPHMWLCEGHLLRLLDPKCDINYTIFQEQWRRGQPVLVSDVGNKLNSSLWHPESFTRDFGNQINDLIDCTTSDIISDQPMSKFWNGFENAEERLCDKQGNVMLLKLKDWPASADFAETLPDRFQDLMNCLPLKEYTHRNGRYNLASHLPDCYIRPDLGPKMYTAYGNAGTTHKKVGTTNLHLDISDAVNVMVYVAITKNSKDYDYDWHVREALQVIEEAGCDDLTLRRIYVHGETPGALWHIYHASDADSIRDLLIKVSVEHGTPIEQFSDPIHDQSHYLDEYLRERLYREYGIKGYAIVQYYGDAVFIPAGAPHQVRNLHNCIKVAEDFVSPENVHHSFRMTQEFRNLTDSHTNHEDKLQIKNIVFHAVKDSISVLMRK